MSRDSSIGLPYFQTTTIACHRRGQYHLTMELKSIQNLKGFLIKHPFSLLFILPKQKQLFQSHKRSKHSTVKPRFLNPVLLTVCTGRVLVMGPSCAFKQHAWLHPSPVVTTKTMSRHYHMSSRGSNWSLRRTTVS